MPGPFDALKATGKRFLQTQNPATEPLLPPIKQPETWLGGAAKSLYDDYVRPLSSAEGIAGSLTGNAFASEMPAVRAGTAQMPVRAPMAQSAMKTLGEMNPEFTPRGGLDLLNKGRVKPVLQTMDPNEAALQRIMARNGPLEGLKGSQTVAKKVHSKGPTSAYDDYGKEWDAEVAPSATFQGWQENNIGGAFPLFNVIGGPRNKSTVSGDTLKQLGIQAPAYPSWTKP